MMELFEDGYAISKAFITHQAIAFHSVNILS
jgi:hypothetical protein